MDTGYTMGGVYTSPYIIEINGQKTLLLACDDFTTDINIGDTWQANRVDLSQVAPNGPQKFQDADVVIPVGDGTTTNHTEYTIEDKYRAAGWLTEQLLTVPSILSNSQLAGQYSFAIWQIFSSVAINGYGGNKLSLADQAAVGTLMTTALNPNTHPTHDVYMYTPSPLGVSQEFIGVAVPEASTLAFLAFNFLILPFALVLLRRRSLWQSK